MILIWFNLLKIFEITSVCKFNFETRTQETIQNEHPVPSLQQRKIFSFFNFLPSPAPHSVFLASLLYKVKIPIIIVGGRTLAPAGEHLMGISYFAWLTANGRGEYVISKLRFFRKWPRKLFLSGRASPRWCEMHLLGVQRNPLIVTGVQGIGKILNFLSRC